MVEPLSTRPILSQLAHAVTSRADGWFSREPSGREPGLPGVRLPIRAKITLPYLLLAMLLALSAAFLVTQVIFDSLEDRFTNQLIETGKLSSEWMVREEDRLLETLRLLANTQGLEAAITSANSERLRELALPIAVNAAEETIAILDLDGRALLSMRRPPGGNIEDYVYTQGEEVYRTWPFVQRVLNGQTDSQGDKFSGYVRAEWGDYFYVSGPIFMLSGEPAGAILVGTSVNSLARQIRTETLAQTTLYDLQGRPISTTLFEAYSLNQDTAEQVFNTRGQSSLLRRIDSQNIQYGEILSAWTARGGEPLGLIGSALPESFLVRTSEVTRTQIFGLTAFAFLLVIMIGSYVARRITRPLLGVVKASTAVAEGNLDVKLELTGNDEVAVLAHSFNRMVANLQQSKQDLVNAYDRTLEGWSRALDLRDEETEGHSRRVTEMSVRLAQAIGLSEEEVTHVRRGALLHDIGKMGIPDAILLKPGKLSEEEWAIMRTHPELAYEMLRPIEYLHPALDIPYCHHEKWDGNGYPRGLKGEEIPIAARIFAVVDVWDALASNRPYRKALEKDEILDILRQSSGSHFDPRVVDAFLQLLESGGDVGIR